ncbi:MAG: Gfo/Idh/MocA family oxidoreductase [Candidatus Shapirobacteria bacterium]|jgi:predicted dehydrogenase
MSKLHPISSAPVIKAIPQRKSIRSAKVTGSKTIAVFGSSSSLVSRLLSPAFKEISHLYPDVNFLPLSRDSGSKTINSFPLPTISTKWVNTSDFLKHPSDYPIDGVILATPTSTHYELARLFLNRRLPVWIEKPISLPWQIDSMVELFSQSPDLFFAADFFMDSPVFLYFLKRFDYFMAQIGSPQKIEGRLVENWPLEPGREWLLDKSINGGGLGMDVLVHVLALVYQVIARLNLPTELCIEKSEKYKYFEPGDKLPPGTEETYMWIKATAGGLPIIIDGGKGTADHYYGIKIHGSKGSVEIFTGTDGRDTCMPYICLDTGKAPKKFWSFPGGGVGYSGLFKEFLDLVYHQPSVDAPYALPARAQTSLFTVKTLSQAYQLASPTSLLCPLGATPQVPEPIFLSPSLPN